VVVQSKIARAYTLSIISELQCCAPTDEGYQPDYPSWKRRYDTYQIEIMSMQPLQSICMPLGSWGCYLGLTAHVVLVNPGAVVPPEIFEDQNNQSVRWPFARSTCVSACVCILTSSSTPFSRVNSLVTSKYSIDLAKLPFGVL
jgi:hypothetical protein